MVDGHSVLFRAFHAYPPLTTKSGELVNAVYGFTSILLSVINELTPSHAAISFDLAEPTFRHQEYKGYKAHRPEAPEGMINQQDRVREVIEVLNIPIYVMPGFEADDVIGTLAMMVSEQLYKGEKKEELEVMIVTGDRDALQLVQDNKVSVYMPGRGKNPAKIWSSEDVVKTYGLMPKQLIDYKALAGDSSDEIPGVKGIGPKTATQLLQKYRDLDGVYAHLEELAEVFSPRIAEKIGLSKESAYMSRKLGEISTNVPLKFKMSDCEVQDYDKKSAIEKFKELEFASLIRKLPNDKYENMVQEELF